MLLDFMLPSMLEKGYTVEAYGKLQLLPARHLYAHACMHMY